MVFQQAGPGIIIQQMMHGNIDEFSGAGIISTRNPCTGQKSLTGAAMLHHINGPEIHICTVFHR